PVLFHTAMLVDEVGRVRFGVHRGQPLDDSPAEAFGGAIETLAQPLNRDGLTYDVRSGIAETRWGLAIVAVGTVVPFSKDFLPRPSRSRLLVLSRVFDADLVARLRDDYLINDLRLVPVQTEYAHSLPIRDVTGKPVAALAW